MLKWHQTVKHLLEKSYEFFERWKIVLCDPNQNRMF